MQQDAVAELEEILSMPAASTELAPAPAPTDAEALIEPLYGIPDVARILGVHRTTVYRMMWAGRFPGPDFHVGTLPRFRHATFRRWLAAQ
jgi:excisionase family DNA binding protein